MFNKETIKGVFAACVVVLIAGVAGAAESDIPRGDLSEKVKMYLAIAAGFGMGLGAIGGALGQGRAIAAAMEGIARNPGADKKILTPMLIGVAFIEVAVILTFVITIGLSGKI